MQTHIVIDERRCHAPKAARPFGVALRSPLDSVACLRVVACYATALRSSPAGS